ncbi:unnamed protein product [Callosobruchus maculatus]|uniref:Bee-milk protein n=1 Tax=Callosobruchus maculatus TaxID=64391 RepID=A0A653CE10_CALMS|nr:unnamed protein product [Callosobruchus maculatus]
MMLTVLLPLVASCVTGMASSLEILNQWNLITFDFPPGFGSNYRAENNVFTGVEVSEDRIFLSTPRLRAGVAATLAVIPRNTPKGSSPTLTAYPDWSFHDAATGNFTCNGLTSVYRTKIDNCNRLWVLDAGTETSIDNYMRPCDPKILIFDLRNDQLVRTIVLPQDVVRPASIFTNIVLDETIQGNCDAAFAYITDTIAYGLVVYDGLNDRAWRFQDPTMYPNPDNSQFEIVGERFSFMDGIIGLTHSSQLATVFYQPLASDRIFSVPTSVLTAGPPGEFDQLPVSLAGRKSSQGLGLAMNLNDNTLYFSPFSETSIAAWNAATNQQELLASDPVNLQFVADLRWKREGALYALSTRFHRFFMRSVNPAEINLRLIRIPLNTNQQQQQPQLVGNSIAPWQQISATSAVNPLQQYREFYYK